jgi:hypothetical protein
MTVEDSIAGLRVNIVDSVDGSSAPQRVTVLAAGDPIGNPMRKCAASSCRWVRPESSGAVVVVGWSLDYVI